MRSVFSRPQLEEIFAMTEEGPPSSSLKPNQIPEEQRQQLRNVDLRPRVFIRGKAAEVVYVAFSPWFGFFNRHFHLLWPNSIYEVRQEMIMHYNLGIPPPF
jgi:hypothetical protein